MIERIPSLDKKRLLRIFCLVVILWTAANLGFALIDWFNSWQYLKANLVDEARDAFNKDLVIRRWVAAQGGIYVFTTKTTPPNPYLAHVPDYKLVTEDGRQLTLINPAYFLRQLNEMAFKQFGLHGHITSSNLLRPANRPDAWESAALRKLAQGQPEVIEAGKIDGQPYLRLMRPLFVEKSCLKCHAKQGYKVGDFRGGISISINMHNHLERYHHQLLLACGFDVLLWLAGLLLIWFFYSRSLNSLRSSQEQVEHLVKLSGVFEQAHISIAILNPDGVIEAVNPAAEKMLNESSSQLVGHRLDDFPYLTDEERDYRQQLLELVKKGKSFSGVITRHLASGKLIYIEMSIFPLRDKEGRSISYAIMGHDVTMMEEMRQRLLQAQKMEAIGTLASGVAHDFNNILTVINGTSEILLDECEADSPIRADLLEIHHAGCRAASLTRQLLAFSRKQIIQPRQLCLRRIFTDLMKMMQRLLGENIQFVFEPPSEAISVEADPIQIEQVLVNLLLNAREAVKERQQQEKIVGKIELSLQKFYMDEEFVQMHEGCQAGWKALIEVADNGCGMSEKVLEHCFEPFYTTRELGRGTGLGLATVYGIVKQNRAAITIVSQPGVGTKVRIFWPLLSQSVADNGREDEFEESYLHIEVDDLTVLLVEDEMKILRLAERYLLRAGFRVLSFPHGQAAVEYLEGTNEVPDILFTDMVMPGMGGEELAAILKDRYPGIMIIYTTGYNDGIARDLDENEVFLRKPYTKRMLMMALEELLIKRKSHLSKEV
ncbi:MAG: DUF3365 domain-containing protein [Deltaproteobacteria bacterium]|nr:DUF3365 domain-containing protein [Deltaproteobacteria bacterium]